jgi:hypothetical protein
MAFKSILSVTSVGEPKPRVANRRQIATLSDTTPQLGDVRPALDAEVLRDLFVRGTAVHFRNGLKTDANKYAIREPPWGARFVSGIPEPGTLVSDMP